ncbi:MAG: YlbL family protein [Nocardioides sp.]
MTRSTRYVVIAVPLLLGLLAAALFAPLPYVVYSPGPTVDVLGENKDGEEYITIDGATSYRDDGELRMTTVYVSYPDATVNIFKVMKAWVSPEESVYPRNAVYPAGETREEAEQQSAIQMTSSQDVAIAAALSELEIDSKPVLEVLDVIEDAPADGKLKARDELLTADGTKLVTQEDVVDAVEATPKGESLTLEIRRDNRRRTVTVTPRSDDGQQRIGIIAGTGFTFPFEVDVDIPDNIGGPSAGLMFSLAIYDTLTPGSLTEGEIIAGTGTIEPKGEVGPIGGIHQKIAAAGKTGAKLFLVPAGNCAEALGAPNGDMRLVRADTLQDARKAIETWIGNRKAKLPTCEGA